MSKYIPQTKNSAPQRKYMKMESYEHMEKIKACVKEVMDEREEEKAEGEEGGDPAVEAAPADISSLIEQAMDVVAEKRKSRKDDGEELGDITADEVMEAVAELLEADAKGDDPESEEKGDDEEGEEKDTPAPRARQKKAAARRAAPASAQRKYSAIYMSRPGDTPSSKKSVPPAIQLARAIKCLDVFGRHDPDMASFYAKKKYDDADMAREFKALSATNPSSGGYLIPEIYLEDRDLRAGRSEGAYGEWQPHHSQDDRRCPCHLGR